MLTIEHTTPDSVFVIRKGTVEIKNNARLNIGCGLLLSNVRVVSAHPGYVTGGLNVFGQQQAYISFCDFDGAGINAFLFYGGNRLYVSNTTIKNTDNGLHSFGKGVTLQRVTFTDNVTGWRGEGIEFPCFVKNSTLSRNTEGLSAWGNIFTSSANVSQSALDNNHIGAHSSGTFLTVKCGSVKNNAAGFRLWDDAILNLSTRMKGGYVDAGGNQLPILALNAWGLFLDRGYNYLVSGIPPDINCSKGFYCPTVASGTLQYPACNSNPGINAFNNQWNPQLTPVSRLYYDLETSEGCPDSPQKIDLIDTDPKAPVACGTFDPPAPFPPSCFGCRVINTADFAGIPLDSAAAIASLAAEGFPALMPKAVNLFYQLLNYPLGNPSEEEQAVLEFSLRRMHQALASGVEAGIINVPQGGFGSSPSFLEALAVHDSLIRKAEAQGNYYRKFYTGIGKAQLYRLAGQRQEAIALFDGILPWTQPGELALAERWRCLTYNEHLVLSGTVPREKFDSLMALCPDPGAEAFAKKSTVPAKNEPQRLLPEENNTYLSAFPNPAQDKLNIFFHLPGKDARVYFELLDITGKKVATLKGPESYDAGSHTVMLDNPGLEQGMYFIKMYTVKEIVLTKIMIVKP